MRKFQIALAVLCVAMVASPAIAAPKQKRMSGVNSIRAECARQAGGYYRPGYGWYAQGGIGTAQMQRFYDCLDSHTMKRR